MSIRLLIPLLLFLTSSPSSWGQVPLSEVDITINFKNRFYEKELLLTTNEYVYTDSTYVYLEEHLLELGKSLKDYDKWKHGKWIEFFGKNWQPLAKPKENEFYSLTEYDIGISKGNSYFFTKQDKLHHMTLRNPPYKGGTFNGFRVIWFDNKEKVTAIHYERFLTETNVEYVNRTAYFENGNIKSYTLRDEENSFYHIIEYNKKGRITYELVANEREQYKSKRKWFGRIEIRESIENGTRYKSKLVNGVLKWKKKIE